MKNYIFLLITFISLSKASLAQTDESIYYSLKYNDTSSVIYNNYLSAIAYDSARHQLYVSMSSFNNYFPADPRPWKYGQLMIINPDNGEIIHSYIDSFPDGHVHEYIIATIIDSFIYWSGIVNEDSYSNCNKRNSVLLKTDMNLNPVWRIIFDYPYKSSRFGNVHKINDSGSIIYSFNVANNTIDTCFIPYGGVYGAFTAFCKIDSDGNVYADSILIVEAEEGEYIYSQRTLTAKKGPDAFWSAGTYKYLTDQDNFIQIIDTNLHAEELIMLNWTEFSDCLLFDINKSSMLDEYYVSGFIYGSPEHEHSKGITQKMDAYGNPIWVYIQEGDNVRSQIHMSGITPQDDIIMLGFGTLDMENDPRDNGIVYKINNEGNLEWMRDIKESPNPLQNEYLHRFILLPNGDIIAAGWTGAFDSTAMRYRQYGWLVRIDKHGCQQPGCELLSTDQDINLPNFSIYPNPTSNGIFYISLDPNNTGMAEIEIINALGQKVYRQSYDAPSSLIEIDLSVQSKGIYYVTVKTPKGQSVKKITIL